MSLIHLCIHDERTRLEAQGMRGHDLKMMKSCVSACVFALGVTPQMLQNAHLKPAAPVEQSSDCGKMRLSFKALP